MCACVCVCTENGDQAKPKTWHADVKQSEETDIERKPAYQPML